MISTYHLIRRQVMEVDAGTAMDPHALSDRISRLCSGSLPEALNRVLDRFDEPGKTIRLDRLDIELDCPDPDELEDYLLKHLPVEMELALQQALSDRERVEEETVDKSLLEAFVFYLKNGFLPWNTPANFSMAELEARIPAMLQAFPPMAMFLARELSEHPQGWRRLIRVFSKKRQMVNAICPGFAREWTDRQGLSFEAVLNMPLFWKELFYTLQQGSSEATWLARRLEKVLMEKESQEMKEDLPDESMEKEEEVSPQDDIFIKNAGAVILHPFIKPLLEELGAVRDNEITKPGKALAILHFAVTGNVQAEEWELPLMKLLCGIPINRFVRLYTGLLRKEMEEIDNMLTALIGHWDILKNSSIESLRESFLQREGRIAPGSKSWTLRVQQKGMDVLVGHLPWSIGFIQLPWMERPVITEWV